MDKLNSLYKLAELIVREKTGELTAKDQKWLEQWLKEHVDHKKIYQKLLESDNLFEKINELNSIDTKKAFQKVDAKISDSFKSKERSLISYWKYAAAILVLIVSSFFTIHYFNKTEKKTSLEISLVPGQQKAVLITASNQKLYLDRTSKNRVIEDQSVNITQSGSILSYALADSAPKESNEISYNTLITPRGGEYQLVLSDGTEVYLNAESKIIYPVAFNGDVRQITLEGEAYFKVSKSKIPFVVNSAEMKVRVYGTSFNVHAYKNEQQVHTTLVEGSVGVQLATENKEQRLVPHQQLRFIKNSNTSEINKVEVDNYIAWTNGKFVFENEPIENILESLSRWYDFNYEFQDERLKKQRFTISVGRYENISPLLKLITLSSELQFTRKNEIIIVQSK